MWTQKSLAQITRGSFALVLAVALAGCVLGAPPGFSDGDKWSVPLVGTLETGELLVPVTINGKGPYLFILDPDLTDSGVDATLARELNLPPRQGEVTTNFNDNQKPTGRVQVNNFQLGTLGVRNREFWVLNTARTVRGRTIRGAIGRNVLTRSLMISVDRDLGMATIATPGSIKAPAGAYKIDYDWTYLRKLAKIKIDGNREALVSLDYGSRNSMLWPKKMEGMPVQAHSDIVADEWGYMNEVKKASVAKTVTLGKATQNNILFSEFADKRETEVSFDGLLGQNFFAAYNLTINMDNTTMWLKERNPDIVGTAATRLRRWGTTFDKCDNAACVEVTLNPVRPQDPNCPTNETPTSDRSSAGANLLAAPRAQDGSALDPNAGKPAAPAKPTVPAKQCTPLPPIFHQLQLTRSGEAAKLTYDILMVPVDENGKRVGSKLLRATLPANTPALFHALRDPIYQTAKTLKVVDVNPFARACEKLGGGYKCVWEEVDALTTTEPR